MASNLFNPEDLFSPIRFRNNLDDMYSPIRYRIISIICQTWLYGIYLCLVPIAVHTMVTRGLQSRSRKWLLGITTSMFALLTVYWVLSVVFTFLDVDSWNNVIKSCYGGAVFCPPHMPAAPWLPMFDDILLVNYIIADGVVVWRAWVLCSDQSRVVLMIPVVTLGINTVIYLMMVAVRAAMLIFQEDASMHFNMLNNMINGIQLAHQSLSLFINISATSIIAVKTWKYRKWLMESGIRVRLPTQASMILTLLVESGMIYILIGATFLVSLAFNSRFGGGELSDVFMPVGIQLVGMYPVIVVLLVEQNRSLNSTYYSFGTITNVRGGRPSQVEPMSFATGLVPASGRQIGPATKPISIDIHVTFDSTLDPEDTGMSTGNSEISSEEHTVS